MFSSLGYVRDLYPVLSIRSKARTGSLNAGGVGCHLKGVFPASTFPHAYDKGHYVGFDVYDLTAAAFYNEILLSSIAFLEKLPACISLTPQARLDKLSRK